MDATAARRGLAKGYYLYVDLERGLLEWVGPTGVRWVVGRVYELVRNRGWFPVFFVLLPWGVATTVATTVAGPAGFAVVLIGLVLAVGVRSK